MNQSGDERLPVAFNMIIKPYGAQCNLRCTYCDYATEKQSGEGDRKVMDDATLEEFTRQYITARKVSEVIFDWQGAEPLLMGRKFFELAVHLQHKYIQPGMEIRNSIRTNGTLIDDEWCRFLRQNDFFVEVEIDGPGELHDTCRIDREGQPTLDSAMSGIEKLRKKRVSFNTVTRIHSANADYPLEVYRFLRDAVKTHFVHFIPVVAGESNAGGKESGTPDSCPVTGTQYGTFMTKVFDEWVRRDVGSVFVETFDSALSAWTGNTPGLCIFDQTCGTSPVIDHNGNIFSCDRFTGSEHCLGNVNTDNLAGLVQSEQQVRFGLAKKAALPELCRECDVRFICNGGCPADRTTELNRLCDGYRGLFTHIKPVLQYMGNELNEDRPLANVMYVMAQQDAMLQMRFAVAQPDDPCPCGSGRYFRNCHGMQV